MGFEIEIKAHIKDEEVESLKQRLLNFENCQYLGETSKIDIYWAKNEEDPPIFRIRKEINQTGTHILFTSKPLKDKDYGTEYNVENEFEAMPDQWNLILNFFSQLGYVKCRYKEKSGFHFIISLDGFDLHCEVLYVKFLGWFIETEITFEEKTDNIDKNKCEQAILKLLDKAKVDRSRIEPIGYNKMLVSCGHPRG